MVKLGLIQTTSYETNDEAIFRISKTLKKLGRKNTEIVCLPEQWLRNNVIRDFDTEFYEFKKIAKEFSMTIIPGAFYDVGEKKSSIISPVIGPDGEIIGKQVKIHPFGYEKDSVKPGTEAKIFNTACKFGVIICYDMVFPNVANTLARKGAQVIFSPSRIVKKGIEPWQIYIQARALENRIPILAANVENIRFGGSSIVVDLNEKNNIVTTKITRLTGEREISREFTLDRYEQSRKNRFSDSNKFQ